MGRATHLSTMDTVWAAWRVEDRGSDETRLQEISRRVFFQPWECFLNWSKFNMLSTRQIRPSSYDAAHSLLTLLRPLCSGASPPTQADSSPLLFFSFFSRYAKPCALAPSANSTQCGAPLSHDVPPLPPLPKSAQKRGTSSVQVKAV